MLILQLGLCVVFVWPQIRQKHNFFEQAFNKQRLQNHAGISSGSKFK